MAWNAVEKRRPSNCSSSIVSEPEGACGKHALHTAAKQLQQLFEILKESVDDEGPSVLGDASALDGDPNVWLDGHADRQQPILQHVDVPPSAEDPCAPPQSDVTELPGIPSIASDCGSESAAGLPECDVFLKLCDVASKAGLDSVSLADLVGQLRAFFEARGQLRTNEFNGLPNGSTKEDGCAVSPVQYVDQTVEAQSPTALARTLFHQPEPQVDLERCLREQEESLQRAHALLQERDQELVTSQALLQQRDEEIALQRSMLCKQDSELLELRAGFELAASELVHLRNAARARDKEFSLELSATICEGRDGEEICFELSEEDFSCGALAEFGSRDGARISPVAG